MPRLTRKEIAMNRIARLGFALLVAGVTMFSGKSEAALCGFQQCLANADCSTYVCPSGHPALPRCNTATCNYYCFCF